MGWKILTDNIMWIGLILIVAGLFLVIYSRGMFSPIICAITGAVAIAVGLFDLAVSVVTRKHNPLRR